MSSIPSGPRPKYLTVGRIGMYCFILVCALFFLMPLYVMVITSLKDMDEIRAANILNYLKNLVFMLGQKLGLKHVLDLYVKVLNQVFLTQLKLLFQVLLCLLD